MEAAGTIPANEAGVPFSQTQQKGLSLTFFLLSLYLVLLFLRPHDWFPELQRLKLPLAVASLCVASHVLGSLSRGSRLLELSPTTKCLGLITLWMLVGAPFAFWKARALDAIIGWSKLLVLFLLLSYAVTSLKQLRRLLWICSGCVALVSALALTGHGGSLSAGIRLTAEVTGPYSGANYFSITILTFLPFVTFVALSERNRFARWSARGLAVILVAANILTHSRTGTIGFLLILLMVLLKLRHVRGPSIGARLLVLIGLFVSGALAPPTYWQRMQTLFREPTPQELQASPILEQAIASEADRWERVRRGMVLTLENPVVGVGPGNFVPAEADRWTTGGGRDWVGSHNTYVEVVAELGLPGLAVYCLLLWRVYSGLRQARRKIRATTRPVDQSAPLLCEALLTTLVVYVVVSGFADLFYDSYFFVIAGLSEALRRLTLNATSTAAPAPEGMRREASSWERI